jgi:hypothetical protein
MHRASDGHPSSNLPSAHLDLDLYGIGSSHALYHLPLRAEFGISSANPFWPSVHGGPKCLHKAFVPDEDPAASKPKRRSMEKKADPALPKPASFNTAPLLKNWTNRLASRFVKVLDDHARGGKLPIYDETAQV